MTVDTANDDSVAQGEFPKVHSSWAFKLNSYKIADENAETYLKLHKAYKVVFASAERRYSILSKMHSEKEASEAVREQREKEATADVLIQFITSGYNTMEYRILRNTPNLPVDVLALLCDGGNLCFGYRALDDVIIVNTD